jgi:seryl-tRNA synthetase
VIDVRRLADEEQYRAGLRAKGVTDDQIAALVEAEAAHREQQQRTEDLRARQNAASKEIGRAAPDERQAKIAAAQSLKSELAAAEEALASSRAALDDLALQIPNPTHPSVPRGGEEDYEVLREVGERVDAPPFDHADYGARMGFTDGERGVRTSGSRFAYVMREAVLLELALVQWVMRRLTEEGFVPVAPPVLVQESMMVDAGFFPTDRNQVYEVEKDQLFLVGTSEIPLAGLHRGERLAAEDLPARYAGFSTCFRREAGTYGKDTRGIFRVHQFDKVEMFSYCAPDRSWEELDALLAIEEGIYQALGLPYRVIVVAAGDLGAPAAKKYDIEAWLPSEGRYREVTSCSNYTDYSARRLDARVSGGGGFVHTLNGTACAVARTLLFLFEHYQQPDGSFVVPEVLRPFTGFEVVEARDVSA